jgi:radical SAM superfamily enzyme YgiQ (UPF0313 family)
MKILLASLSIEDESRFIHDPNCAYSIGLAYIYSVLEKAGYSVKLLFLNNFDYETAEKIFFATIKTFDPQIVGFQLFSFNRVLTFKFIEKLNKEYSDIQVVLGGVHASIMYDQIIRKYPKVILVIGEGESIIVEVVGAINDHKDLSKIKGIVYYDKEIVVTEPRHLIEDLNVLPFPKHEVFFDNDPQRVKAHIVSSRGCPFNCSFCCLKIISKRRFRKRAIENVVEEIVQLKEKYPRLKHIQFHDDTFTLDRERVINFCKLVIKEKMGITFECSARVKPSSYDMFRWMEKAGFTKIMFGLETGSPKLLDSIHKNISQQEVIDLFETLRNFSFIVTTFLMCGFPGESEETVSETIKFVQKIQKIKYSWICGASPLIVYPGTEIYSIMKGAGHIGDDFWLTDNSVPYYTVEHSFDKLIEFENRIMDAVSLERIFTLNGFRNHFLKMPFTITKFIYENPLHIGFTLPNVYRVYKRIKSISLKFKVV